MESAVAQVSNLTVPLTLIAKQWFQSNKAIFTLQGPGKYDDLDFYNPKGKYKKQKLSKWGFVYPILKASGMLEKSLTDPSDPESFNMIINNNQLIVGTTVKYAQYLQEGTSFMPPRPVVLYGAEQVAPDSLNQRRDIWIRILQDYVGQILAKEIGAT